MVGEIDRRVKRVSRSLYEEDGSSWTTFSEELRDCETIVVRRGWVRERVEDVRWGLGHHGASREEGSTRCASSRRREERSELNEHTRATKQGENTGEGV